MNIQRTFLIIGLYSSSIIAHFQPAKPSSAGNDAPAAARQNAPAAVRAPDGHNPEEWAKITKQIVPVLQTHVKTMSINSEHSQIALNHNGSQCAAGFLDGVHIWDVQEGRVIRRLKYQKKTIRGVAAGCAASISWNRDGTILAATNDYRTDAKLWNKKDIEGCNDTQVWNCQTGARLYTAQNTRHHTVISLSSDGSLLANTSDQFRVCVTDEMSRKVHTLPHQTDVRVIAWSHDDSQLATGSDDHGVRIWNTKTGELSRTFSHGAKGDYIYALAWNSHDTQLASGDRMGLVCIWDTIKGTKMHTLQCKEWVPVIAWSPHDRQLATGSANDGVCVWDAQTGQKLLRTESTKTDPCESACSLAWAADGSQIIMASNHNTIKVWDISDLADEKYQAEHKQLLAESMDHEKLMVILLCDDFRKKHPNVQASLKTIASFASRKGISTGQLACALLTMHPLIRNGVLAHYTISVERENMKKEYEYYEYKALKQAMNYINKFRAAIKRIRFQNTQPLAHPQAIETILEGYLIDPENYLSSYQALEQTVEVAQLQVKEIKPVLEEYIVEKHPENTAAPQNDSSAMPATAVRHSKKS